MRRFAISGAALVLCGGLLAGCGDGSDDAAAEDEPSATPTPTASETASELPETDWGGPAKGPKVRGSSYVFHAPKGWENITQRAREVEQDVDAAVAEGDQAPFRDNLTVKREPGRGGVLDQLEADAPEALRKVVPKLQALPRVTIDGREAIHHRGPAKSGDSTYFFEQFLCFDQDDNLVAITFSFARQRPAKERDRTVAAIMAGWRWKR